MKKITFPKNKYLKENISLDFIKECLLKTSEQLLKEVNFIDKERRREYRKSEKYKEYQKQYHKSEKNKEYQKQYQKSEKNKEYQKQYYQKKKILCNICKKSLTFTGRCISCANIQRHSKKK